MSDHLETTSTSSPLPTESLFSRATIGRDAVAGLVVFVVALPLCLGIALASGAPLMSGIVSGIVGGLVVGSLSGSHTSVSGPAAALAAVVVAQLAILGSFEVFLLAVVFAGVLQIGLGLARAGFISTFVPTSVIKGLLAAIGIILILKQIPHVLGHDSDPEGEMAFLQPDRENTFSELLAVIADLHPGAASIGLLSVAVLFGWTRSKRLSGSRVPAPLAVVVLGLGLQMAMSVLPDAWAVDGNHLVQVPASTSVAGLLDLVRVPDFSAWANPDVHIAAVTIAVVASLATLLNLEAIDRLDPRGRVSPANRELWAQGAGNIVAGLLGGIPVTSVVIRGSVNVYAGAATKLSAVIHGLLLLSSVAFLTGVLNRIPLSCLGAILLVTGYKLASPALIRQIYRGGRDQFVPFAATVLGIVFTDLLVGLGIGMAVSLGFVLSRHSRRTFRRISEKHAANEVLRIELPELLTFLNLSALELAFHRVPGGSHLLLDATQTTYIDPDILALIREFRDTTAPARSIQLSMKGFHESYALRDDIQFVDFSTRELQDRMTPEQVALVLRHGNERFYQDRRINRDLARQLDATADAPHPMAVVLSCIDSRTPAELVFDMGLGDIFSVRVAGNVLSDEVLGSMEYGCAVAGARLVVVMGHTRCGAVTATVELAAAGSTAKERTGCDHLDHVLEEIEHAIPTLDAHAFRTWSDQRKKAFIDEVARHNVRHVARQISTRSPTMRRLVDDGRIAIIGALYDVKTGKMDFFAAADA